MAFNEINPSHSDFNLAQLFPWYQVLLCISLFRIFLSLLSLSLSPSLSLSLSLSIYLSIYLSLFL